MDQNHETQTGVNGVLEDMLPYNVTLEEEDDNEIISRAVAIIERRFATAREDLSSPQAVRDYLRLKLACLEHEVFMVIWLDSQNRVIAFEELFRGTLMQTSVFPREVVKQALKWNAAAAIFAHNHPSGVQEPSRADENITDQLRKALNLIDVRVTDHMVIGGAGITSFAEKGLL